MCGVAGVFSRDLSLLSKIQEMTDVQSHRGPDGAGYLLVGSSARLSTIEAPKVEPSDFLALGHRRLAILDCSPAGAQPMASADGENWLSFNGEIYNYIELREELRAEGFKFHTETDTEVVLCAYEAWGVDCFKRFNGMWAIALWDGVRQQLILSRDRLGVKPLFYIELNGAVVFSSEIKGVLASGSVVPRLNLAVAMDYLKWSVVDHGCDSFFAGVKSFPPGHTAVIDHSLAVKPFPFWSLDASVTTPILVDKAVYKFRQLFQSAVQLRLRSDVPVGFCLSGGLDSSAIVCQANILRPKTAGSLHTFNAASDDPRFDERRWCNLVNESVGASAHHVFPSGESFEEELDALLWHQEEPFTSASIYAQWAVMRDARVHSIPVLLDGQGADEGLCGYRKFYLFHLMNLFRQHRYGRFLFELVALIARGDRGLFRFWEGGRYLPSFLKRRVSSLATALTSEGEALWSNSYLDLSGRGSISERQYLDLTRFSVPSLLRYEDRNSMAWSIESRVPFLDYRLVEWLVSLPAEIKMNAGRTKALMRRALRGIVPDAILDRRDKMGFVTAQEVWMRTTMRSAIESCFEDKNFPLSDLVDASKLLQEYRKWQAGLAAMPQQEIFRVFILARWMRRFNVRCD